jgi:hypothetical protein
MANNQIIISRIQNRRGLKENLPQPLLPGEIALTVDTGELWIGSDPNQPPYGVRTYSAGLGDIGNAEDIVNTQIVSVKYTADLSQADFDALLEYLTDPTALSNAGAPAVSLTEDDILWDGLSTIFIAAIGPPDIPANTINNILEAVELYGPFEVGVREFDSALSGALGALNDPFVPMVPDVAETLTFTTGPDVITRSSGTSFITEGFFDGQKIVVSGTASNDGTYTIAAGGVTASTITVEETLVAEGPITATTTMLRGRSNPVLVLSFDSVDGDFQFGTIDISSNSVQGSNAAILINELHGAGLVTTFGNLQITTSGIGVGTPAFRDMTVTDTDLGYSWTATGTASADSTTDELTFVSGSNVNIDIDTVNDAIRISNTGSADPDTVYTGFTTTPVGGDVATEATLANTTGSFTDVPNVIFDIDGASDVIFIEYSLNTGANVPGSDNFTAVGNMRIVASNTTDALTATLVDDQTVLVDTGYTGAIEFQAVRVAGTPSSSATDVTFSDNGGVADTITYDAGPSDFLTDGFSPGDLITVNGSTLGNNGTYTIDTVNATTITLISTDTLVDETVSGVTITGRNQVKLQFTNTFSSDALFRFVTRRWMSYDYVNTPLPTSQIMAVTLVSGGDGGGTYPLSTTSLNATSWTTAVAIDDGILASVSGRNRLAYSSSLDRWVSVGGTGNGIIMTSDDNGTTWVERSAAVTTNINSVRWDTQLNQFIIVGTGIETSSDGITWNSRTVDGTSTFLQDVAYDGTNWVVTGYNSFGQTKRSTDGIAWNTTLASPESFPNCMMGIGTRLFLGGSSGVIRYSDNGGTSWTAATGTAITNIHGFAHNGAGVIVAVGEDNSVLRSTDNGVTQTPVSTGLDGGSARYFDVIYDTVLGLFIAGGRNSSFETFIATSPDGNTWTERVNNGLPGDAQVEGIASANQINPFAG